MPEMQATGADWRRAQSARPAHASLSRLQVAQQQPGSAL